ncbi:MAG: four helix bundle protein, partial [Gemmatimonadales bacterium]
LVHRVASEIARDAASLARSFRGPAALERGDQLVRAACSITSNIAEACGRGTVPEFRQFVIYARGSAHKLRSQIQVAALLDPSQRRPCRSLESRVTLVIKMLGRLHEHPPPER